MPARLYELESEQINAMQSHPIHRDLVAAIARLIRQLGDCVTYADVYDFQQDLLEELIRIEEHRAGCSRVVKRLERGRGVPSDAVEVRGAGDSKELATWRLEHDVCERAGRQLRCVGDALAWKVFDYQRNFIAVLSRNAPPGPMAGKLGLIAERRFITETWRDGHFALLHDLTWCLRIGDATVFMPGMFELREIKTNDKNQRSKQKRRIYEAAEALRSHTPMPGGAGQVLVQVDLPYTNHLDRLRDLLDLASRRTLQSIKIPGGRAMTAVNMFSGELASTEQESADRFGLAFESVKRRAGIAPPEELVKRSVDMVGGSSVAPPWAAYPLSPDMRAALIADVAFFYVGMDARQVIAALGRQGLQASWLQRLDEPINISRPVLEIVGRFERLPNGHLQGRRLLMNLAEMDRLLFELMDLDIWAQQVAIVMDNYNINNVPPWPYFPQEREVWGQGLGTIGDGLNR